MMKKLLTENLRAAATWIGSPILAVAVWILWEWFFSTEHGAVVGLIVGPVALLGLALMIGGFFYVFRK